MPGERQLDAAQPEATAYEDRRRERRRILLLVASVLGAGLITQWRGGKLRRNQANAALHRMRQQVAERLQEEAQDLLDRLPPDGQPLTAADEQRVQQWFARVRQYLARTYGAGAAILVGPTLSLADEASLAQLTATQYAYLGQFEADTLSGRQHRNGTFRARAGMYGRNSWNIAQNLVVRRQRLTADQERRIHMGKDKPCRVCREQADLGWVSVGTLREIGDSPCQCACHCTFKFRNTFARRLLSLFASSERGAKRAAKRHRESGRPEHEHAPHASGGNCGTGTGGFQPGNTCGGHGGLRSFEKVKRADGGREWVSHDAKVVLKPEGEHWRLTVHEGGSEIHSERTNDFKSRHWLGVEARSWVRRLRKPAKGSFASLVSSVLTYFKTERSAKRAAKRRQKAAKEGKSSRTRAGTREAEPKRSSGGGNCGTGHGGFQPGNSCGRPGHAHGGQAQPGQRAPAQAQPGKSRVAKPKAAKGAPRLKQQPLSEKALRAKANASRVAGKAEHVYSKDREYELAKKLGGHAMEDNEPVDVLVQDKKNPSILHGIELKTIVNGRNDKITMKKSALALKEGWLKRKAPSNKEKNIPDSNIKWDQVKKRVIHTVVLDKRDAYKGGENKDYYSGHELYYRDGIGSFRIGGMQKVKDSAELLSILSGGKGK